MMPNCVKVRVQPARRGFIDVGVGGTCNDISYWAVGDENDYASDPESPAYHLESE